MQTHGFQQYPNAKASKEIKAEPTLSKMGWQSTILAVGDPTQSYRLVDNVTNIYVCNDMRLITNFEENPTKVGGLTSDSISPGGKRIQIRLTPKNGTKGQVLTLTNVFNLSHSLSNLVSLSVLNDAEIFHYNKDQTLYNQETQKVFVFVEHYNTSFFL